MPIFQIYNLTWIYTTFLFCLLVYSKYHNSKTNNILRSRSNDFVKTGIYCIIFAFVIGFRQGHLGQWVDSFIYACTYNYYKTGLETAQLGYSQGEEWVWASLNIFLASLDMSVYILFFVTACGYIGFMYICINRLIPNNQWIALLFFVSSFSFFTYSCNGIRNGLACSLILLALSYYVFMKPSNILFGLLFSFLAFGVHRTTILPTLCVLAAMFVVKNCKVVLGWWVFAILLSLALGPSINAFFASLGFDDRMQQYAVNLAQSSADSFSRPGFRWDFLIYSAMPIWLGYYIVLKKKIHDRQYEILLITYTLANSFWVMVIQAAYSNRFAYLSWFMYPLVVAYPLLKIPIWPDQDKKTVNILMLYVGFTLFMNIIYS